MSSVTDEEPSILEGAAEVVTDVMTLVLRVGTCSLMVHHGFDKIQNVDGFSANVVAKYFGFLPGPASFWTLSAAATQVAGAGLLSVGVLARPVALAACLEQAVAKSKDIQAASKETAFAICDNMTAFAIKDLLTILFTCP